VRRLALLLLALSLCAMVALRVDAQELPTLHGYLGYYLYFRVDAPSEAKVNSSVSVFLTLRAYDDLYVYDVLVWIYGCGVNISTILFSETWLRRGSQYVYVFPVTPREEGFLRIVIAAEYYFIYQGNYYYQYGGVATNITAVRAITYSELRDMYARLRADYESLLANYTELKRSYEQLQSRYSDLLSNYTVLLELYRGLNKSYSELVSQYLELSAKHSQLLSLYNNLSARYRELSSQYEMLLGEHSALRKAYNALAESYESLLDNYIRLMMAYDSLSASYGVLREDYSSLLANYSSLESSYQKLRRDYESLRDSYAELLNKHTLLESRYAELLDRYRELSREHEALQATIAERARALETLLYVAIVLGAVTVALATLVALLARRKK
jgi:predicted nuclease with TOPRIM domain